jgi:predicted acyl esterase
MVVDVTAPKYDVKMCPIFIPIRDGIRLAAELYMPDAEGNIPVVVHYWLTRRVSQLGAAGFIITCYSIKAIKL